MLRIVSSSAWAQLSCFLGHHQEPREGLYLHEAQELAEGMRKTTTWMGQPTHQQVFPITIVEGWWAISMSHIVSECWDHQFPMETIWRTNGEAQVMSSWTDEDEDGGTHPSSPSVTFIGRRRRHSWGQHRVWTPLPHLLGLGHSMNPIPYPPQLNFPPPPIIAPILLGVPPHLYSLPPLPITALLAPALPAMQVVAAPVQANLVNIPAPITQPIANPATPAAAHVLVAGGPPDPTPCTPPGSPLGSVIAFNNISISGSSTTSMPSVRDCAPHPWVLTGGFHLPDLTSLMDTVAYEMWKNTIGFFHLSGCTDELIMPIVYQSIKGDMALDIVTHRPHMNLHELITWLNNNFGVISDEDTLMKELYTIKQDPKESAKHFNTWISYAMMRLAVAFPHTMPTEWADKTQKIHFLSGQHPKLKSTLDWEMCLDGGRCQMTYEEIKDAAWWVEQREDPSMLDDLFVRENAVSTPRDDGHWDQGGQPWCNQGHPQYGNQTQPSNHSWPAVRVVNMEDHRVDCPDGMDGSDLDNGVEDVGFDPNDYESVEEPSSLPSTTASLLPPHVKAAHIVYHCEQQKQWCYTCDETGHFFFDCPVCLQALKDKKGLNWKGTPSVGGWKPLKQPERAMESAPPRKWDVQQHTNIPRTWCPC